MDYLNKMQEIEENFKSATGLTERKYYSIFYTMLGQSNLLVLNFNPGGTPDNYKIVDIYKGQHEYIEGYGPTSNNMGKYLMKIVGSNNPDDIRHIQASNIIWRRSKNMNSLAQKKEAAIETAPHLKELIKVVDPSYILFGGQSAKDLFVKVHKVKTTEYPEDDITGPNGTYMATYFSRTKMKIPYIDREIEAFTILHPCKGVREQISEQLVKFMNGKV